MTTPTAVRATHDPFAPAVRFPRERLLRALDEETVARLEGRFATLGYADARTWTESRRTVSNDDLRAFYSVPEDATVESLQERRKDDLLELAVALGVESPTGTKEELSTAILSTRTATPVTPETPAAPDAVGAVQTEDGVTHEGEVPASAAVSPQDGPDGDAGPQVPDEAPAELTEPTTAPVGDEPAAPVGEPAPTPVGEPGPESVGEATTSSRRARR